MNFESIHNYYETIVYNKIVEHFRNARVDNEYLADVACVALNHLPPRYIRHDVDMAFYLSPVEREEIDQKIISAIENAIEYIDQHRQVKRKRA